MTESSTPAELIVLDILPHGRSDDDRPQYQKSPVAYAVDPEAFGLYELLLAGDNTIGIDDRIDPEETETIEEFHRVDYDGCSSGAQAELEYIIEELVQDNEDRFVEFFNEAQPITLRLHQLNLLPGIGKKLRNSILDERKRKPFEDFEEVTDRVAGLHDPVGTLVDRILEEMKAEDLKYRIFVTSGE